MKRSFISLALCAVILLASACSAPPPPSSSPSPTATPSPSPELTAQPTSAPSATPASSGAFTPVTVEEQLLFDQDGVSLTLKSLTFDSFWGPVLKVVAENNTEKTVVVSVENCSINNVMVYGSLYCEVSAGKKSNDEIDFNIEDVAMITTLKDIEIEFEVYDSDTYDTLFITDTITITTSADPSFEQMVNEIGEVVYADNDLVVRVDSEVIYNDSYYDAIIYVYAENHSGKDIAMSMQQFSVNGFMIDPYFYLNIISGKVAYGAIEFYSGDLDENDIEAIEEIEFKLHVYDTSTYSTLFDSDTIMVAYPAVG